jgi:hypothetical protein
MPADALARWAAVRGTDAETDADRRAAWERDYPRLFGVPVSADEVIAANGLTDRAEAQRVRATWGRAECPEGHDGWCWCNTCLSYGDGGDDDR